MVEDDCTAASLAKEWLEGESHIVDLVYDGNDGNERALYNDYDLLILDWELPGKSGLQILQAFRKNSGHLPVLFVTGRSTLDDKIKGFEAGADDYLTKPYELRELSLRVKALLRRPAALQPTVLDKAGVQLYSERHKVFFGNEEVSLKPREFALLELLMVNANKVYSGDDLKDRLWQFDAEIGDTGIRVLISRLRQKLGKESSPIKTVYGVGYTFSTEP